MRVAEAPVDALCNALADSLWEIRDVVPMKENKAMQKKEERV